MSRPPFCSAAPPPYRPIAAHYLGEQKVAASKYHNYLFIALCSTIKVYCPTYPYQTLPAEPFKVLESEAVIQSHGDIDVQLPHAINSLTVGELGTEEVLVSAHDDGDVCVWYTRDLSRMALRLNVRRSAWGVALHKARRLLAVSSNLHEITVFELAAQEMPPSSSDEEDLSSWEDDTTPSKPQQDPGRQSIRPPNTITTLTGHRHNIPSISFLDDNSGRWLAGTSIDGTVVLWDVHAARKVEECRFSGANSRGWSVTLLNPQAFKPVQNLYDALGQPRPRSGAADIPPRKTYLRGIRTLQSDYYASSPPEPSMAYDISPPSSINASIHHYPQYSESGPSESEEEDNDEPADIIVFAGNHLITGTTSASADDDAPPPPLLTPAPELDDSEESDSFFPRSSPSSSESFDLPPPPPPPESPRESPVTPPTAFIFATTQHDAYLLPTTSLSPTVQCRAALYQDFPPVALQYLGNIDRLNMVHVVPELSLVVAASQKGMLALFRLTRCADAFCIRLDETLPREGLGTGSDVAMRPPTALLGVAVSPVQSARRWRAGRWRLMAVWADGKVLSYELRRGEEEDEAWGIGVGMEGVVMV